MAGMGQEAPVLGRIGDRVAPVPGRGQMIVQLDDSSDTPVAHARLVLLWGPLERPLMAALSPLWRAVVGLE